MRSPSRAPSRRGTSLVYRPPSACAEAGKRLCDDDEWLRACRGSSTTTYPYGNTRQPGVCNDDRDHPAIEFFGTAADWIWSELGNACISQIPNSVDTTGENEGCVSEDGVHDMMGNVPTDLGPHRRLPGRFYADTSTTATASSTTPRPTTPRTGTTPPASAAAPIEAWTGSPRWC